MGGLGAAASERGAEVIMGILYPGKTVAELSQEERQQISALSQLATGLAIAASGGDIQDINTGVAAGKNAVENNYLNVVAKGASQLIKQGGKVCVKNTVCRTWATEQLIYAAATVGISLEVSDIDPDQLANIIDNINDNINLSLGPVGYSDFLTDKLVDYVLNNNKKPVDSSSANNNIAGSGSVAAGGAPGLPPDDDDDNRHKQDNQKYQNQKQQERFDELRDIYDKNNPTTDLKIDGQTIRQGAGGNRYSTRIYESQNLTDKQIHNYAEELAGQPLTKVRDGIYTARLKDGTNITLRNVSHSDTGARWTVEIRNSPSLARLYNGLGNKVEIKFR
ncbi:MAG: VENN motif pre-toxin domain-containing protein [Gilliamella sp.]|nr:VENN motif pre-toxin domain-containing protein [Gilliamella sp.]